MNIFPPDGYDPRYWVQDGTDAKWTRWFAWYPVRLVYEVNEGNGYSWTDSGTYAWWSWVECRLTPDGNPPNDVGRMQFRQLSSVK